MGVHKDVYFTFDTCRREGLNGLRGPVETGEVVFYFTVVDEELAGAFADAYTGDSVLSSACSPKEFFCLPFYSTSILSLSARASGPRADVPLRHIP